MWPVYASADETQWLIVSGVGRVASAAATAYLAAATAEPKQACWLNFGIAGHPSLALGDLRRAGKICDSLSERVWYPAEVTGVAPATEVLTTVDHPSTDFPGGGLVEMEAAGFFPIASRLATRERVQVVKVVSDNAAEHFDKSITAAKVSAWVTASLDSLSPYADALVSMAREVGERGSDRSALLAKMDFRLTVTQTLQFERLMERLQALGGNAEEVLEELWAGVSTGRDALKRLEAEVSSRPLVFQKGGS